MSRLMIIFTSLFYFTCAIASNLNFLKDAPVSEFTPADTRLFQDTLIQAIKEKKDGEKLAWQNKETGASGFINPLSTYQDNDISCRDIRIVNRAKNKIAEYTYKFCKKDGKWAAIKLIK